MRPAARSPRVPTLAASLLALAACSRPSPELGAAPAPAPGLAPATPVEETPAAPEPPASSTFPEAAASAEVASADAGRNRIAGEKLEREPRSLSGPETGTLTVTRRSADEIDFSISVFNGYYMGEIEGTAVRRGTVLRFPRELGDSGCVLTFTSSGPGFRVDESGGRPNAWSCLGYHGANVDFSGLYRPPVSKIRPSFECKEAQSPVALAICADEVLADLDRELDRAYRAKKAKDGDALARDQRRWLDERASCTREDGEATTLCLVRRYLGRLGVLGGEGGATDDRPPSLFPALRAAVERGSFERALWEPRTSAVLRVMLGPRFYTFRRSMGSLSAKMDAGYACIRGGVPGLFGSYEGLISVGPVGDVWVALLDDDGVELYTLGSKADGAPPPMFDAWQKGFSYKKVKRLDVPYAPR